MATKGLEASRETWPNKNTTLNMAIKLHQGRTKLMSLPVTTSQAFKKDSLVAWNAGLVYPAVAGHAGGKIIGVIQHAIASTDDDYATARNVEVKVPTEMNVVWECDVDTTHALTSTDMGDWMDLSSESGLTSTHVDAAESTEDIFLCVGYISATKGLFVLNMGMGYTTQTDG